MTKHGLSLTIVMLLTFAFIVGWSTGARQHVVRAQSVEPRVQFLDDGSLIVYYPDQKKGYLYKNALAVGMPQACSSVIKLSNPGGPITREGCKARGLGD